MLITLTEDEINQAQQIAKLRNQSQRDAGRPDGLVKGSSLDRDTQGALSELAVSKALNLPWDGSFIPISVWDKWKYEGNDVGKLEIRSTSLAKGRLILHPKDKDFSPYVLVLSDKHPEYQLIGWLFGAEGKNSKYWRNNVPKPCFMVPQTKLNSMDSLFEAIENKNV